MLRLFKCFDTVVHSKLMYRFAIVLQTVAIVTVTFLMERKHHVKCAHLCQGMVLGPLLFLCFSTNITGSVNTNTLSIQVFTLMILFGFKGVTDPSDCQLLQNKLNAILSWAGL